MEAKVELKSETKNGYINDEKERTRDFCIDDWVDAQEMAIQHATFYAPTEEQINEIRIGNIVKICNTRERFWVRIIEIDGEYLYGDIRDILMIDRGYDFGDTVRFERKHIYDCL